MYSSFIEQLGLPDWMTWVGPMIAFMIATAVWNIYKVKRHFAQRAQREQRVEGIKTEGLAATATVLHTRDTGTRLGNDLYIIVELRLAVQPDDGTAPFEASVDAPISPVRLPDFSEGKQIKVRFDPQTREVAVAQRVL